MKKIYLLLSIFFFSEIGIAQVKTTAADTARWNSLKEQLKNASGTTEIDLLNELSWEYMWVIANEGIKTDSAALQNYIKSAQSKSRSLNYKKGLAHSYLIQSKLNKRKNKPLADSLRHLSKLIAENLNDQQLLGRLAVDEGMLKEAYEYYRQAGDIDGQFEVASSICQDYSVGEGDFNEKEFSYCQRAYELADVKRQRNISYMWRITTYAYGAISNMYNKIGDRETAWKVSRLADKYAKLLAIDQSWDYAIHYSNINRFDSSAYYYEKAIANEPNESRRKFIMRWAAHVNSQAGDFKRSIEILNIAYPLYEKAEANKGGGLMNWRGDLHRFYAAAYDSLKQKADALKHYELALQHYRKFYNELKDPAKPGAPWYGYDGSRRSLKMYASQTIANIFNVLGIHDSAYQYHVTYTQLKDSLEDKNRLWRLNMLLSDFKKALEDEKRSSFLKLLQKNNFIQRQRLAEQSLIQKHTEAQLSLLNKDNEITNQLLLLRDQQLQLRDQRLTEQQFLRQQKESSLALLDKDNKLKDQQLKQQAIIRNALLGGLFVLLAIGVFAFRFIALKQKNERLRNEKRQAELQHQSAELEMQALRAQMNPHFIFNCLSSINRFIFKNDNRAASDYLTKFSRLIRMVLLQSQKRLIPLEDELEMLRLYLDMERLRFKDGFDYSITTNNTIDAGAIFIPPLLLQPFCENAIWHGLMHLPAGRQGKDGQGQLNISITENDGVLFCSITDNGVGRQKAAAYKSKSAEKEKSLGLKITNARLELLNGKLTNETAYKINDIVNEEGDIAGTKVDLKIRYKNSVEEITQYA